VSKNIFLVHPAYAYDDENLLAAFENEVEAQAHLAAREASGESDLNIIKVQLFSKEMPKSTVLYFESADILNGDVRGHHKWSQNYWHYQLRPPTTARAKVITNSRDTSLTPSQRVVIAGTSEQAVHTLFLKETLKAGAGA
jgi:hypothetical protein